MRIKTAAVAAALLALCAGAVQAQDARYMAGVCANCHGTDGKADSTGGMPGLAGLSRPYFIEQMNAFKQGKRQATVMHQIAKGFNDSQISMLADYFAAQKK
jgi:sulfide dehydrogenase cytochrome subunit